MGGASLAPHCGKPRPDLPYSGPPSSCRAPAGRAKSLSAAKRMHVHRERVDGPIVEPAGPCRHHTGAAVGNSLDNRRLVRAVEPDLVGEVGRAEFFVALGVVAMATGAIICEDFPPFCEVSA